MTFELIKLNNAFSTFFATLRFSPVMFLLKTPDYVTHFPHSTQLLDFSSVLLADVYLSFQTLFYILCAFSYCMQFLIDFHHFVGSYWYKIYHQCVYRLSIWTCSLSTKVVVSPVWMFNLPACLKQFIYSVQVCGCSPEIHLKYTDKQIKYTSPGIFRFSLICTQNNAFS